MTQKALDEFKRLIFDKCGGYTFKNDTEALKCANGFLISLAAVLGVKTLNRSDFPDEIEEEIPKGKINIIKR